MQSRQQARVLDLAVVIVIAAFTMTTGAGAVVAAGDGALLSCGFGVLALLVFAWVLRGLWVRPRSYPLQALGLVGCVAVDGAVSAAVLLVVVSARGVFDRHAVRAAPRATRQPSPSL
ncbi:hypothetical protein [Nocardioides dongkuii]|uniref:hypothetical protein n=1 Tax=Nocardioides dongkuii TaxID=2760089 RepID=UPI001878CAE6|nr:hypothetical protein [Nocardioides dongkuii]